MSESLQIAVASAQAAGGGYAQMEAEASLVAISMSHVKAGVQQAVDAVDHLADVYRQGERPQTLEALAAAEGKVQRARALQASLDKQMQELSEASGRLVELTARADDNLSTFADEFRRS